MQLLFKKKKKEHHFLILFEVFSVVFFTKLKIEKKMYLLFLIGNSECFGLEAITAVTQVVFSDFCPLHQSRSGFLFFPTHCHQYAGV